MFQPLNLLRQPLRQPLQRRRVVILIQHYFHNTETFRVLRGSGEGIGQFLFRVHEETSSRTQHIRQAMIFPRLHVVVGSVLHGAFGFIPLFGAAQTTGASLFTAGLILSVMVLPIVAALSRDLFLRVPRELQDGALALGATRWEVLRGVVLPSTASGVVAAAFLGLGRALGEAIAVTQVVGAGNIIHASLFTTGDTLARRIAEQFPGAITKLHTSALFYLALLLLAIGLLTNLLAQYVAQRFGRQRGVTA